LKSATALAAAATLLVLLLSLRSASAQTTPPPARSENGRYQIFIRPNAAGTFLLDTQTGRVWQNVTVENASVGTNGDNPWIWQDRIDNEDQLLAWMRRHKKGD